MFVQIDSRSRLHAEFASDTPGLHASLCVTNRQCPGTFFSTMEVWAPSPTLQPILNQAEARRH